MFLFKTLKCINCTSVIVNLPEEELKKLHGLTFRCECCNYLNLLKEFTFVRTNDTKSQSAFGFK
jgi:hypothetical protein